MGEAFLTQGDPTLIVNRLIEASKPVYDSWSGTCDEGRNSYSYVYKENPKSTVPSRCSVYLNNTAYYYYSYNSTRWDVTSPTAGQTVFLTPGSTINFVNARATCILGMESTGRLYFRSGITGLGGSSLYFNLALTWEY